MNLSPEFRKRYFDSNGLPLAGGMVYTYAAGTTTPQVSYLNSTGTTNTNPVVLDSQGYGDIWFDPTLAYKIVLADSNNNVQWSVDNINFPSGVTTWNANTIYSQGAIVLDSSGYGLIYVSLTNSNQGNALTNPSAWRLFAGNTRTVSTNTTLAITDNLVLSNSTSGNLTHTLPPCSTSPIGLRITIKDIGSGGNATSIQGSGTDTIDGNNIFADTISGNLAVMVWNSGSAWRVVNGYFVPDGAVTQKKLATRPTGSTVAAGGIAISSSSGASFSNNTTTPTAVTNLSVTITTAGRPVVIALLDDATSSGSNVNVTASSGVAGGYISFIRDSTTLTKISLESTSTASNPLLELPSSSFSFLDIGAFAGTHTYTVKASAVSGSTIGVQYTILVAYEL